VRGGSEEVVVVLCGAVVLKSEISTTNMTKSNTQEQSDRENSHEQNHFESNYSEDDEYSDYYNEQLFEWAREQAELESLRHLHNSGEMEDEASKEIWGPFATAAKSLREMRKEISSTTATAPNKQVDADHTTELTSQ